MSFLDRDRSRVPDVLPAVAEDDGGIDQAEVHDFRDPVDLAAVL